MSKCKLKQTLESPNTLLCNGKFEENCYEEPFHPKIPPDKYYEGLDADGWYPVKTRIFRAYL